MNRFNISWNVKYINLVIDWLLLKHNLAQTCTNYPMHQATNARQFAFQFLLCRIHRHKVRDSSRQVWSSAGVKKCSNISENWNLRNYFTFCEVGRRLIMSKVFRLPHSYIEWIQKHTRNKYIFISQHQMKNVYFLTLKNKLNV